MAERTCCCHWLGRVLLAISRMLCSVAVPGVTLPTVSDLRRKTRHGLKWPDTHLFRLAGWPGGSGRRSTYFCALPGWPAGATLEGSPAYVARRARGRSRCHAERLPGLLLSEGLMANKTPLPGLVCSAAPLAQSRSSPNTDIHPLHVSFTGLPT